MDIKDITIKIIADFNKLFKLYNENKTYLNNEVNKIIELINSQLDGNFKYYFFQPLYDNSITYNKSQLIKLIELCYRFEYIKSKDLLYYYNFIYGDIERLLYINEKDVNDIIETNQYIDSHLFLLYQNKCYTQIIWYLNSNEAQMDENEFFYICLFGNVEILKLFITKYKIDLSLYQYEFEQSLLEGNNDIFFYLYRTGYFNLKNITESDLNNLNPVLKLYIINEKNKK